MVTLPRFKPLLMYNLNIYIWYIKAVTCRFFYHKERYPEIGWDDVTWNNYALDRNN
jgi:hypothetical protein